MLPEDTDSPDREDAAEPPRRSLLVYVLAPLFLALAAVGTWGWTLGAPDPPSTQPAATSVIAGLPTPAAGTDVPGDGVGIVAGPATPWAVPGGPGEATATAAPTPTAAPIALLGPPAGSVFGAQDVISFYWMAPLVAADGRLFVVYLAVGDELVPLGGVAAANMGTGYRLQAVPGAAVDQAGSYSWFVVLENEADGGIIGRSESRPMAILGEN